jgi:hypothetical protein
MLSHNVKFHYLSTPNSIRNLLFPRFTDRKWRKYDRYDLDQDGACINFNLNLLADCLLLHMYLLLQAGFIWLCSAIQFCEIQRREN